MPLPKRYNTFTTRSSNFTANLYNNMVGDPYWDVTYSTAAVTPASYQYSNFNTVMFKNKADPTLYFLLNVHRWSYGYYMQFSMYENTGVDLTKVEATQALGAAGCLPFNSNSTAADPLYTMTVLTTQDFIFLHGQYMDNGGAAFPLRLWMGRLNPYAVEDPAIANDFVGIFGHYPIGGRGIYDANIPAYMRSYFGEGLVRKSRTGKKYAANNFYTNSQLVSPGSGGRYYISPFYVCDYEEGVRGEFKGFRVATFKDSLIHPDGSILDVGGERYYVFHEFSQYPPQASGCYVYGDSVTYGRFYFPDGGMPMSGTRAFLIKI